MGAVWAKDAVDPLVEQGISVLSLMQDVGHPGSDTVVVGCRTDVGDGSGAAFTETGASVPDDILGEVCLELGDVDDDPCRPCGWS